MPLTFRERASTGAVQSICRIPPAHAGERTAAIHPKTAPPFARGRVRIWGDCWCRDLDRVGVARLALEPVECGVPRTSNANARPISDSPGVIRRTRSGHRGFGRRAESESGVSGGRVARRGRSRGWPIRKSAGGDRAGAAPRISNSPFQRANPPSFGPRGNRGSPARFRFLSANHARSGADQAKTRRGESGANEGPGEWR